MKEATRHMSTGRGPITNIKYNDFNRFFVVVVPTIHFVDYKYGFFVVFRNAEKRMIRI